MNIQKLLRKSVINLKPYSSARDEFEGDASIWLDANENPYPTNYNRYPDPHQKLLKKTIGDIKSVASENIFLGNGSDEAIDLLFRAFCEPAEDEVLIPQPTYGMYAVSAAINNVRIVTVSLTDGFDINVAKTLAPVTTKTKIIFLCSPNNPSGNLLSKGRVIEIIEKFSGLVVIDEAYIDFALTESFTTMIGKYNNVVVLQTLSKAWGLAGLRLGMCFADAEVIAAMNKIKPPYNISGVTQQIALEKLSGQDKKDEQVAEIITERKKLAHALLQVKVVERVFPSDANFLLVQTKDARGIYDKLLQKGIVVRDRSSVILCGNCLRITVGTPKENEVLLTELGSI